MKSPKSGTWRPELRGGPLPPYLQLVDAIAADIQNGTLGVADRLPPQRELAARLKLNYATVSRAYGEAQRRGLIYSRVGQGTFVCRPPVPELARRRADGVVDMTMNSPPEPDDAAFSARLDASYAALAPQLRTLLRYDDFGSSPAALRAASAWLGRTQVDAPAERVLVCPGAQSALLAILSCLARPGDVALCEALTYPGVRTIAAQLGIRLVGLAMDAEGVTSEAFARACTEHHPKLLYLNPTLQNPTTCTVSEARRRELLRIARHKGVTIVEDDAYGVLPSTVHTPCAVLAPDITYYVSGFAKSLGPGLRIAYLVAPDARSAARVAAIVRATVVMASPITAALATECVANGTAAYALEAVRAESVLRQQIAREELQDASYESHPEAFHLWLTLPARWGRVAFAARLREQGIRVVTADAFCVHGEPPDALRVGLGGATSREEMRRVLAILASTLREMPVT